MAILRKTIFFISMPFFILGLLLPIYGREIGAKYHPGLKQLGSAGSKRPGTGSYHLATVQDAPGSKSYVHGKPTHFLNTQHTSSMINQKSGSNT